MMGWSLLVFTTTVKYLPNVAKDHHRRSSPSQPTTNPTAKIHAPPIVASGINARPTGSAKIPAKKTTLKIASARRSARVAPRRTRNACDSSPTAKAAALISNARPAKCEWDKYGVDTFPLWRRRSAVDLCACGGRGPGGREPSPHDGRLAKGPDRVAHPIDEQSNGNEAAGHEHSDG
jgi:hypothetical protein